MSLQLVIVGVYTDKQDQQVMLLWLIIKMCYPNLELADLHWHELQTRASVMAASFIKGNRWLRTINRSQADTTLNAFYTYPLLAYIR